MGRVIGEGGWGCVLFTEHIHTGKTYAVKMMSKKGLIMEKQVDHAKSEVEILSSLSHPFIVNMYAFEQDSRYIYLIQEFIRGGEFLTLLNQKRCLDVDTTRFFSSQIVLVLEYLHSNNIVYRDLKPENMLVDKSGYLKIIDFGLSKKIYSKTYTICGTPHYIAPEILLGEGYDNSVDWYSLGVMLYEMMVGMPPHVANDTMSLFKKIINDKVKFPSNIDPKAKRLIKSLLKKDPSRRICNKSAGIEGIKNCGFFKGIDFNAIHDKDLEPPFFPSVESDRDTSNFKKIKVPMLNKDNSPSLSEEDDIFLDW